MKRLAICLLAILFGAPLAFSQTFEFDKGHSFITFTVNRFATVDVSGKFKEFSGSLEYNSNTEMIESATFSIDVASLDSGHEVRDGHLKGETWLDAAKYPKIEFQSKSFVKTGDGYEAMGILSIHGITKEISIPFQMFGPSIDPTKTNTLGVSAELTINRQDFGISFSRLMDNGKLFIGNDVEIKINALTQSPK